MTSEPANLLVFSDAAGTFYLLSPDMLDRARVPAEQRAEIEQLIAAEVSGYAASVAEAGSAITLLGMIPDATLPTHGQADDAGESFSPERLAHPVS